MAEQVVLAIGDACGDVDGNPGAAAVGELARQLVSQHPEAIVLLLGDNAYNAGTTQEYAEFFVPILGIESLAPRVRACPDYHTAGAVPYFSTLGVNARWHTGPGLLQFRCRGLALHLVEQRG